MARLVAKEDSQMAEIELLGRVGRTTVYRRIYDGRGTSGYFLGCGLDALIIMNQGGKAPLPGLTGEILGLGTDAATWVDAQLEQLAEMTRHCDLPRLARLDCRPQEVGLSCIVLTHSTSSDYYYKNFKRHVALTGRAIWHDYLYAVTYHALWLACRNPAVRRCGITHLTDSGDPIGMEYMLDGIYNFSVSDSSKSQLAEVVFLTDSHEEVPAGYKPASPHEEVWNDRGHSKAPPCEYIDLKIRSPLLSERYPGPGARKSDPG
jgi:hypothetical protein